MSKALIMAAVRKFYRQEVGATMVEYALMIAFIAAVCVVSVQLLGTATNSGYQLITGYL